MHNERVPSFNKTARLLFQNIQSGIKHGDFVCRILRALIIQRLILLKKEKTTYRFVL